MNTIPILRLCRLLALPLLALSGFAQNPNRDLLPVAVLDFDAPDGKLKERGAQIALLVTSQLSGVDGVVTVERQELAKLLGEQELGASGMIDPATSARIGHLTGARALVVGRIFTVAGETIAALKLMSTETGRVFGVTESFGPDAPLSAPAAKLSEKLAQLLATKRADLLAVTVASSDRAARIKQKLGGRKLPTLAISIPEQHIGPPVVDPAVETEIGLVLGQAGFTLLSGEAAAQADIRISGEAFSEAGIRRGNLISCRARAEVKAVAREGGRVLLVDRQTTWAVDTAEHVAAKTALQRAGAELAERIADSIGNLRQ